MNARQWFWAWLFVASAVGGAAAFGGGSINPGPGPAGGGGGGVTEGQVISGGTANRFVFTNADGGVSTASPALGEAAHLTSTLRVDGASDLRGAISNGGSGTCNSTTVSAGLLCTADSIMVPATTAGANGGYAMMFRDTFTGRFRTVRDGNGCIGDLYCAGSDGVNLEVSTSGDQLRLMTTGGGVINANTSTDIAAGASLMEWRDNGITGNLLMSLDGAGNLFLNASATRSKGTITLAAGTGTVTVASGSVCVCGNTSALNAVQCAVSSTTLTATGTGTDVIAYSCW
jgi:hypothetical protein